MSFISIEMNTHGVARVGLNRPDVHNALNDIVIRELYDAFDMLGRHKEVRVITLTGTGKSFSAGADLTWMQRAASQSQDENQADAVRLAQMFDTLNACPKPVVGLVNGAALGGGVGLTACCDIVVAATSATFGLTEVRLGLIPATISPYVIAKIGAAQARRFMLTGERFDAATAKAIGLVHEVADDIETAAQPIVDALLSNGPNAMADTKRLIRDVAGRDLTPELRDMTAQRIAARRASDEGSEGMAAFLDKRKPDWISNV
jgi:methylglutaconyl-CoA hydratase